jgi:hypothetical protein
MLNILRRSHKHNYSAKENEVTLSLRLRTLISAVAAVLALISVPSHATIISATSNNPYAFNWSSSGGGYNLAGLGSLTVSGFNSNLLTLNISLTNSTVASVASNARLTSFGFGINPDATAVSFSDTPDAGLINASLANIPSLALIEVCAFGGPNCSGGGNGGIMANGGSDSFSLVLKGTWGASVDINPIGFKYQTNNGSFEFTTGGSNPVPEPGSIALLAIGLLGVFTALRKRRA